MSLMLFQKISRTICTILLRPSRLFQAHTQYVRKSSTPAKATSTAHTPTKRPPVEEETPSNEVFFPHNKKPISPVRNKVALVTGGTDLIGSRCVKELLQHGAKGVMIADTNEKKGYGEIIDFSKQYGAEKVAFIKIKPANYALLKNAFISTKSYFKGLDIVINNVRFKEQNWDEQIDEYIKGLVLSTQLSMDFMGKGNGGQGGTIVNISSDYKKHSESCPIFHAVQDFIIRFDRTLGVDSFDNSKVKVLTICKATLDGISTDLVKIISKGSNGCVWMPQ